MTLRIRTLFTALGRFWPRSVRYTWYFGRLLQCYNKTTTKWRFVFIVLRKDALILKKYDQVGSAKLNGFEVLLTQNEIHVRFCLTLFPKSQKISRNRPSTSNFDLVSIFEPDVFKFDLTIYQKSNSEEKIWKIEKRSKTIVFQFLKNPSLEPKFHSQYVHLNLFSCLPPGCGGLRVAVSIQKFPKIEK